MKDSELKRFNWVLLGIEGAGRAEAMMEPTLSFEDGQHFLVAKQSNRFQSPQKNPLPPSHYVVSLVYGLVVSPFYISNNFHNGR